MATMLQAGSRLIGTRSRFCNLTSASSSLIRCSREAAFVSLQLPPAVPAPADLLAGEGKCPPSSPTDVAHAR